MKKLLSTMLAFVMLATTITALPLTSFAKTFTDSDVKATVTADSLTAYADEDVKISEAGGYLLYKATAQKDGVFTFYTTGGVDTYGYLLSSSNLDTENPIFRNDDGGENSNCCIDYFASPGETVYFAVRYYSSTKVDELFNVHIDFNETYSVDDVVYLKDTDAETGNEIYCVKGYKFNTPTDVTIPSEINGIPVTYIAEDAFNSCEYLTSVTIPGSVKTIDSDAFCLCANLKTVILNEGLENIADWAFGDTAVESVTIPASVKDFNSSAFACCYDLKSISVADANEDYKSVDNVVYSKDGTKLVYTLPSLTGTFVVAQGVKSIEFDAFYASLISGVKLSSTVEYIGCDAFEDCYNLSSVELNEGLKTIDEYAFENCNKLFSVKLPSTLETIAYRAFAHCGFYSIEIPASVNIIGSGAFQGSNVEAIIINNKNTELITNSIGSSVTIYGHTGSTAETYANSKGNTFVSIDLGEGVECTHSFVKDEIITAPTCASKGLVKTKCAICGAQGKDAEIEMLEHNVPAGVCTECGYKEPFVSDIGVNQSITCTISDEYRIATACFTASQDGTYTATISDMNSIDIFVVASNTAKNSFYYIPEEKTATFELKAGEQIFISAMNSGSVPGASFKATVTCNHGATKTTTTKATTKADGKIVKKCTACDKTFSTTAIPRVSSVKLSTTSYVYNGKAKTPSVIVKDRTGKTLVKNTDYTVSYASGRKYVGKYAVKITFKGKYSGTKTLYFYVKPKTTSISSLTAGSKKFTVKWKKQATQTTGYQIQYSTSSKFTKAKTVTISKNGTTSKTISKLSGKKKYYVRVRTYKVVKINGKATKIYSGWSKAKYVTTKK